MINIKKATSPRRIEDFDKHFHGDHAELNKQLKASGSDIRFEIYKKGKRLI